MAQQQMGSNVLCAETRTTNACMDHQHHTMTVILLLMQDLEVPESLSDELAKCSGSILLTI